MLPRRGGRTPNHKRSSTPTAGSGVPLAGVLNVLTFSLPLLLLVRYREGRIYARLLPRLRPRTVSGSRVADSCTGAGRYGDANTGNTCIMGINISTLQTMDSHLDCLTAIPQAPLPLIASRALARRRCGLPLLAAPLAWHGSLPIINTRGALAGALSASLSPPGDPRTGVPGARRHHFFIFI